MVHTESNYPCLYIVITDSLYSQSEMQMQVHHVNAEVVSMQESKEKEKQKQSDSSHSPRESSLLGRGLPAKDVLCRGKNGSPVLELHKRHALVFAEPREF